jgi:hypothetical protein
MRMAVVLSLVVSVALAHPGIGLVEDSKGNVFYTDLAKVWKISPDGKKSVALNNVHTHELFLDENDNLFGEHLWYNGEQADTWGHYVWKFTHGGKFQKVIPDTEGFLSDYSFVRDHFGRMYWADRSGKCQHVVRKNKDNTTTILGDKCLEDVRWMTSAGDGMIYLVDKQDLKKVDTQGKVIILAKSIPDKKLSQFMVNEPHSLGAVTLDNDNNIYVADFSGRQVNRIERDGTTAVVYETSIPWSPMALVVAKNGDFLILETSLTNAVRVERVSKDKNANKKTAVY